MPARSFPRRAASLANVLLALVLASRAVQAGNWPAWRGPAGTSVSEETGLPLRWSETEGIAWKRELPGWGTSTPAIWGDAIFVTTEKEEDLLLLRVSKEDGSIVWTRRIGGGKELRLPQVWKARGDRGGQHFHETHNLASPSPVTDGERVIVHFGNGDLAACDFDGDVRWKRNLQEDHGTYTIWWGHANSPVLHGDLVISACMQDSLLDLGDKPAQSYVVAHSKATGERVWCTPRMTGATSEPCDAYTTPLLRPTAQGPELIVVGGTWVDGYDPLTGTQRWVLRDLGGNRTITGPALGDGVLYFTVGMRGALTALRLGGEKDLPRSAVLWTYGEGTPDTPCCVLSGDRLFLVSDNGIAACLDARTGKRHWRERLPGNYRASPLVADGRVLFLSMEGVATAVADRTAFERLAENRIDDSWIASPAVSDGGIFLRGRKALWCVR